MFPKLKGKAILAPMAGVTDVAFRELCKDQGAAYTVTELISIEGLARNDDHSLFLAKKSVKERPFGVQLFGNNPEQYIKSLKLVEKFADVIDINLGCPAHKVMLQKAGCWLMKEDKKLQEIITALVSNTKLPITVKIRKGIKLKDNDAVRVAKLCEKAGASLITIHGRTQEQGYSGVADWNVIKAVKEAVNIPVVGNGDVTSPEKAKEMIDYTGCDYVMIGRAARGNPFIFKQINEFLDTGRYSEISDEEKLKGFFEYYKLAKKYGISFTKIKMHAMQFTKGTANAAKIREKLITAKSIEEIEGVLNASGN